jgi:hypothetical protein
VQVPVTISWPVPCPPSSLNPCDLLVGNLRESSLSKILSVTNQLEYLQWIWGYHFKSGGQVHTPVIDLDEVSEVLSYARKTLLTVDIVVAPKPKKEQVLPLALSSTKGCLSGLHKFERLTLRPASIPSGIQYRRDPTNRRLTSSDTRVDGYLGRLVYRR